MKTDVSPNLIVIQLLHTASNPSNFLQMCWDQLQDQQKLQIFHYLYLAQQDALFLSTLRQELLSNEPVIPWTQLLALLKKWKKLNPAHVQMFLDHGPLTFEKIQFRIDSPELIELWNQKKQQMQTQYENKKHSLMKELDFAKNQGLKEKRMDALNQLKQFFPKDKVVETAFQSEKEFHARQTYNKLVSKKEKNFHAKKEEPSLSKDQIHSFFKIIKKYLKKDANYAYDFCVMFLEMDQPLLGLKVIDLLKKKSQNLLWHELHICLEAQQHARALNTIAHLQKSNVSNEHSFSLLYYQALALYGLGNRSDAIRIIKNILKIRPQFKSANSLLLEWDVEA